MAKQRQTLEIEAEVNAILAAEMFAHERNIPLEIAMEFADDPSKYLVVETMNWWLRRFDKGKLLIGDRPLLSQPSANWPCGIAIDDPNCLIALPLSPTLAFFASANSRFRSAMRVSSPTVLLYSLNKRTIQSAVTYVYGA